MPRAELTSEELHDVTVAASASNGLEAMRLIDVLLEAGIPAMHRGGGDHIGPGRSDIVVPRVLVKPAREIIAAFRDEINAKGVAEAFTSENVQEQLDDVRRDPLVDQMEELSHCPAVERNSKLVHYISEWIVDGISDIQIARRLAVAGCSPEEALSLLKQVRTTDLFVLRHRFEQRIVFCYAIAAASVFAVVAAAIFGFFNPQFAFLLFGVVFGLCFARHYKSRLRAITER